MKSFLSLRLTIHSLMDCSHYGYMHARHGPPRLANPLTPSPGVSANQPQAGNLPILNDTRQDIKTLRYHEVCQCTFALNTGVSFSGNNSMITVTFVKLYRRSQ